MQATCSVVTKASSPSLIGTSWHERRRYPPIVLLASSEYLSTWHTTGTIASVHSSQASLIIGNAITHRAVLILGARCGANRFQPVPMEINGISACIPCFAWFVPSHTRSLYQTYDYSNVRIIILNFPSVIFRANSILKDLFLIRNFKHISDKRLFHVFVIDISPQRSSTVDNRKNVIRWFYENSSGTYSNFQGIWSNFRLIDLEVNFNGFIVGKILTNKLLSFVLYREKNRNIRWKYETREILICVSLFIVTTRSFFACIYLNIIYSGLFHNFQKSKNVSYRTIIHPKSNFIVVIICFLKFSIIVLFVQHFFT